jgi:hypothetical protein
MFPFADQFGSSETTLIFPTPPHNRHNITPTPWQVWHSSLSLNGDPFFLTFPLPSQMGQLIFPIP